MMSRPSRFLIASILTIATLASCSKRQGHTDYASPSSTAPSMAPAPPNLPTEGRAQPESNFAMSDSTAAPAASGAVMPNGIDTSDLAILRRPKVIIKNGSMSLKAENYESSMDRVRGFTQHYGGYISHERVHTTYGDAIEAELTIRVPAQYFDTVLTLVMKMGDRVLDEEISAEELTEQYEQSRTNLSDMRAEAIRLRKIIDAGNLSARQRLDYENQLASLQSQIAAQQSSHSQMVRSVSYSTLRIQLNADQQPGPLVRIWQAIKEGLNAFVDVFAKLLAILIAALPVIALIGLVIYLIIRASRWMRRLEQRQPNRTQGPPVE